MIYIGPRVYVETQFFYFHYFVDQAYYSWYTVVFMIGDIFKIKYIR